MPVRPNLFRYATSELSQDAVLCWLLAWADRGAAEHDASLHAAGRALLAALFNAFGEPLPEGPLSVQPVRQFKGADIVALVGDRHVVVIEDKTRTEHHSNQLRRYDEAIRAFHPSRSVVLVYVKTGDQASYEEVRRHGWAVVTRRQLIDVLVPNRGSTKSDVFNDFLDHLERAEAAVQSFRTHPAASWGRRGPAWTGFYEAIVSGLGSGAWGYVANASGGFMGLWWGWQRIEGGELYLQLEEELLTVKVTGRDEASRRPLRDAWLARVIQHEGAIRFRRPARLGNGRYMTVAHIDGDYRAVQPDGRIDIDATLAILRSATADLASMAEKHRAVAP